MSEQLANAERGILGWIDRDITGPMADFADPNQEWRGPGGGMSGSGAAQGDLFTESRRPDQA